MNFVFFYDPIISNNEALINIIDGYFKTKYDLNKKYIKINVSKKNQLKNYNINYAPCIVIYSKSNEVLGEISLIENNEKNIIECLEKYYNNNIR
jgi:hypothetical protein